IARRLAKLANAPFMKVEATKFTEVGYVGRDVESIIRDLTDIAFKQTREQEIERVKANAESQVIERILDALIQPPEVGFMSDPKTSQSSAARDSFKEKLLRGELEDTEIEIEISA